MQLISITEAARGYIGDLLSDHPGKALSLGYNNKGCSGHKYTFDLVDEGSDQKGDEVIHVGDRVVIVKSTSVLGLIGSTLDLESDAFQQQLVWHNPMAVNQCGCGQSFQIAGEGGCGA